MPTDNADYHAFYRSGTGIRAKELLRLRVRSLWNIRNDERVLCIGGGQMLWDGDAVSVGRMTGVNEAPFSCLVDQRNKPLPDADYDRLIALHLETCDLASFVHEAWRVLKGEGRLLMVIPNAESLWATCPSTPFSGDVPYNLKQIEAALIDQGFCIHAMESALYAAPEFTGTSADILWKTEAVASWAFFMVRGGVTIVAAQKRVRGIAGSGQKRKRCEEPFVPSPIPV